MGFALERYHMDDAAFLWQLRKETDFLRHALMDGAFANEGFDVGFEIEFHLLDEKQQPKRIALDILQQINKPYIVSEVYSSMIEMNSQHFPIAGNNLVDMHEHLTTIWRQCTRVCWKNKASLVAIGTLPTFSEEDMDEEYVTPLTRYKILNERLKKFHSESTVTAMSRMGACSAFHVHFRVPAMKAADYYNAASIASAPVLAISGNSLYFLQQKLWQESRVHLFEAVNGSLQGKSRAFFCDHYLKSSLHELFRDNLKIPLLLTQINLQTDDPFWHVMLHNSSIWRWNRPVISLHNQGPLHVRIEHRSLPAGPTVTDMLANAFLWMGLTKAIGDDIENYIHHSTFYYTKKNFYTAAQYGLDKPLLWPTVGKIMPKELLLDYLLPLAYNGLHSLDVDEALIKDYLGVIYERVRTGQTGSRWQQKFMERHPNAWGEMMGVYVTEQQKDRPISQWEIKS